jgi:hypothetical protein
MQNPAAYRACDLRNSGEAFRQFRPAGLLAGAHELALRLMQHAVTGAVIVCMGLAGLVGAVVTFWPG